MGATRCGDSGKPPILESSKVKGKQERREPTVHLPVQKSIARCRCHRYKTTATGSRESGHTECLVPTASITEGVSAVKRGGGTNRAQHSAAQITTWQ